MVNIFLYKKKQLSLFDAYTPHPPPHYLPVVTNINIFLNLDIFALEIKLNTLFFLTFT